MRNQAGVPSVHPFRESRAFGEAAGRLFLLLQGWHGTPSRKKKSRKKLCCKWIYKRLLKSVVGQGDTFQNKKWRRVPLIK